MNLNKEISKRFRAAALVVVVEDPDELLTLYHVKTGTRPFLKKTGEPGDEREPHLVISAADTGAIQKLQQHKESPGVIIGLDLLRAYGQNPIFARVVREIALQQADEKDPEPPTRLVLIEAPGTEVPASLKGDIEYIVPKIPDVKELSEELDTFTKDKNVKIEGNGEARHSIAAAVAGLGRHEAARLFGRCYVEHSELDPVWLRREKATRVSDRLGGALTFVEADPPDIGGLNGLKTWLNGRRAAFCSEKARTYGLPEPKGVLLLGIPGTGKSLTAKIVPKQWGLPLLRLDAGKLYGSLVGQSEAQTRQAIAAAEACSPCILWIDELEKGFAAGSGNTDSGTSQRVFGSLLTWLQEKTKPVFVVATANSVSGLPPELLRKGRFDEIFFIDLPNLAERKQIANIHLSRRKRTNIDAGEIALKTDGFGGAEIEQCIIDGMFAAFGEGREVSLPDILKAVKGTVPLSKTMSENIKSLRAWADGRAKKATEAGRAVAVGGPRRARVI